MAADRSLRVSNCACAGAAKAQARPIPARRYNAADIVKSSLDSLVARTARLRGGPGREPSPFQIDCMALETDVFPSKLMSSCPPQEACRHSENIVREGSRRFPTAHAAGKRMSHLPRCLSAWMAVYVGAPKLPSFGPS